jgi:gamma-glutamyltranspeptidase/glutathione hydrolase
MQANLIKGFDLQGSGAGSASTLHAIIESIKLAKSDIYRYVADPKFARIPADGLLSKEYAQLRRKLIDPAKAMAFPDPGVPPGAEGTMETKPAAKALSETYDPEQHTTSFSIVDRFGNAVGCTPTLGGLFGSNVVVGSLGLLLNNGMRLGSTSPYPDQVNYVGAGKVPLLNNSPVVVLKEGKLAFVFGSPGGETIGQTEFQVLINLIDFAMPVQEAIEAPRLALEAAPSFYKPGAAIKVLIEGRVSKETIDGLKALGHEVAVLPGWGSLGHMQTIRVDPKTGLLTAGGDPRRTGYAMGY